MWVSFVLGKVWLIKARSFPSSHFKGLKEKKIYSSVFVF